MTKPTTTPPTDRDAVIEECAKICDAENGEHASAAQHWRDATEGSRGKERYDRCLARAGVAFRCAASIRALKSPTPPVAAPVKLKRVPISIHMNEREAEFLRKMCEAKDMSVDAIICLAFRSYQKADAMANEGYPVLKYAKRDGTLYDDAPFGCMGDE